jgi:hypothetical protein
MNDLIKPLETYYNGYKFRSRLEARWAVFFTELRIIFEYEKEGYNLGDNGCYLPDFWLPEFKLWVEVKPATIGIKYFKKDYLRCESLRDLTTFPVLLCYGAPKERWNILLVCDLTDGSGGTSEFNATFYSRDCLTVFDSRPIRDFYTTDFEPLTKIKNLMYLNEQEKIGLEDLADETFYTLVEDGHSEVYKAAQRARQARFEHGEKGGV